MPLRNASLPLATVWPSVLSRGGVARRTSASCQRQMMRKRQVVLVQTLMAFWTTVLPWTIKTSRMEIKVCQKLAAAAEVESLVRLFPMLKAVTCQMF